MGAVESFALPAWSPNVTFARGRNKRALVAVSLGRRTLPGLFSVFSHHGFQEEPTLGSGEPWRKPEGVCELGSPTVARIWSSDLPLYYLSDACTGSSLQTLGET